jgi:hypothetical protein
VIPVTNSDMKSKFSNSSSDPSTIKFTMISDKIHDHDAMNYYPIKNWVEVSTPLKNISQWEGLSHILWKNIKCSKPPTSDGINGDYLIGVNRC